LSGGRNLEQLQAEHAGQIEASFQKVVAQDEGAAEVLASEKLSAWTFGELPELMEMVRGRQTVVGYPALVDKQTHCEIDVFDDPRQAKETHRQGLIGLFRMRLKEQVRHAGKSLPEFTHSSLLFMNLGTQEQLRDQIIDRALEMACLAEPWPENQDEFEQRCKEGRERFGLLAQEVGRLVHQILLDWAAAQKILGEVRNHEQAYKDVHKQLEQLVHRWFIRDTAQEQLRHFPRYLKGVQTRLEKLVENPPRDARHMEELEPLLARYQRERNALRGEKDSGLDEIRWMLEELRIALFAQELRTPRPISIKRIERRWAALQR
ncbi:MAG TPA: DUF3418 domain-containing protein, partial [Burkholderiaceae bacterium]|nr:DUF3418 domain-containing protein [Burkholderiaceae bacterium]